MHTVCDIPENFLEVKKEYERKIPHIDFSLIKRQTNDWYIHQLQDPVKSHLLESLTQKNQTEKEILLEEVLKTYPDRVENALNTYQRVDGFKSYLSDYLQTVDIEAEEDENGPSIPQHQVAIVGHSMYFTYMTATEWPTQSESSD